MFNVIYLHPNLGSDHQRYAVSVYPTTNDRGNELPDNYVLEYTVNTRLIPTRSDYKVNEQKSNDDDDGCGPTTHQWTRRFDDIMYRSNGDDAVSLIAIHWSTVSEPLSLTKDDLINIYCNKF